jgi:hypothetical protein
MALGTPVYAIGSCFAELMAARLRRYLFPLVLNPHGIVYNPVSAAALLAPCPDGPQIFLHDGLWRSLDHHSQLARPDRCETLRLLAHAERSKNQALATSRWLILTLGTAQAFTLAGRGEVVTNCHRLPQGLFQRRRLGVEEALTALRHPLLNWLNADQSRQAVLTVSPVRYLRDGPIENSRGKAALLLLCEALEREHQRITYFPAYEIVIDELRSYRFFERDLVHPNELAADIVWQRFAEKYLDDQSLANLGAMDKLLTALEHRAGPGDQTALGRRSLQRLEALEQRCPNLDFSSWKESFAAMARARSDSD